jgi:hypothetical protein
MKFHLVRRTLSYLELATLLTMTGCSAGNLTVTNRGDEDVASPACDAAIAAFIGAYLD